MRRRPALALQTWRTWLPTGRPAATAGLRRAAGIASSIKYWKSCSYFCREQSRQSEGIAVAMARIVNAVIGKKNKTWCDNFMLEAMPTPHNRFHPWRGNPDYSTSIPLYLGSFTSYCKISSRFLPGFRRISHSTSPVSLFSLPPERLMTSTVISELSEMGI